MKKVVLVLIAILYMQIANAQADSIQILREKTASNIKIAYNSSVVYPGVRTGVEVPFKNIIVSKTKKSSKQKLIYKDRFFTGNLGWYHHPTFQDNLYLTFGYTMRKTYQKGFFTEFSPELGYSRTFLGGTTYKVDENGNVLIKKLAGYNYALMSIGGGLGYDFSIIKSKPISVYYKLNLLTMFSYNSTIYLRPAMELGVIYKTNKLLMFKSKINHINKK